MWLVATVLYSMGLDVHVSLQNAWFKKISHPCTSLYKRLPLIAPVSQESACHAGDPDSIPRI